MQLDEIIPLEKGFQRVEEEGIKPFFDFINRGDQTFFRAKAYVALYDHIFKMCIQRDPYNHSEEMYKRYSAKILEYCQQVAVPELTKAKAQSDIAYLEQWNKRWHNHKLIVKGLSKLFMYLDRFYTPNTENTLDLNEQGFKIFRENVFDYPHAQNSFAVLARQKILSGMNKERNSEEQDRKMLKDAVVVFQEMGQKYAGKKLRVYQDELETHIIASAAEFYQRRAHDWLASDSCPEYLQKAERYLNDETNRVNAYLHPSTDEPLRKAVYRELLKVKQQELLTKSTGVDHLLAINSIDDLSRMYRLYSLEGGPESTDLLPIAALVQSHIKKAGTDVVDKAKPEPGKPPSEANHSLVTSLIALHAQYHKVVEQCFADAKVFQKSLEKAFEEFVNQDPRVSKLLAKFVNDILKKGNRVNMQDPEATLRDVVFLYGYIREKDIFERDYQKYLAERLLNGECESEHSEKKMITLLKAQCGYQWTNKLEGMFKDIQLSRDLTRAFKEQQLAGKQGENDDDVDLEVNVCTTGFWPSTQSKHVPVLPEPIGAKADQFVKFYINKHNGRKIEWRLDEGKAEVKVKFAPANVKTLVVSTYQMLILLAFNTKKVLTYQEVLDLTGISPANIKDHLSTLFHPKVLVLNKKPDGPELDQSSKFMINQKYTNPLRRIPITLIRSAVVAGPGEGAQLDQAIVTQRRCMTDAAIVRIMKTRRAMKHVALTQEVIQALQARFDCKPIFVKDRIEALMGEYLERDAKDRSNYLYKA